MQVHTPFAAGAGVGSDLLARTRNRSQFQGLRHSHQTCLPPPSFSLFHPGRRNMTICDAASTQTITLGDILRGSAPINGPLPSSPQPSGWLSWQSFFPPPTDPAAKKAASRQDKARHIRGMLSASRGSPSIRLPVSQGSFNQSFSESLSSMDPSASADAAAAAAGLSSSPAEAMSNAIPFSAAAPGVAGGVLPKEGCVLTEELLAPVPLAKELRVVLPWLFATAGHLDKSSAEYLSSQLALSRLQVVDLPRMMLASAYAGTQGPWQLASDVAWVGQKPVPSSPAVAAAVTLHRLAHRTGGAGRPPPAKEGTVAVLTYRPEDVSIAAEALAVYFHLYCGIDAKGAVSAAGGALQCPAPPLTSLEAAVEEMAACGKGWLQRVVLEWHYAGGCVEVSGEAVGGWDRTAGMTFNVQHRKWKLQLWGLPPGLYAFKFIVDGHWCIDLAAPSTPDLFGNTNNVCLVPLCSSTGQSGDSAAQRAVDAADGMAGIAIPSIVQQEEQEEGNKEKESGVVESESPQSAPVEVDQRGGNVEVVAAGALGNAENRVEASSASGLESADVGGPVDDTVGPEERLRAARFGAAILAYYSKSSAVRRAPVRK